MNVLLATTFIVLAPATTASGQAIQKFATWEAVVAYAFGGLAMLCAWAAIRGRRFPGVPHPEPAHAKRSLGEHGLLASLPEAQKAARAILKEDGYINPWWKPWGKAPQPSVAAGVQSQREIEKAGHRLGQDLVVGLGVARGALSHVTDSMRNTAPRLTFGQPEVKRVLLASGSPPGWAYFATAPVSNRPDWPADSANVKTTRAVVTVYPSESSSTVIAEYEARWASNPWPEFGKPLPRQEVDLPSTGHVEGVDLFVKDSRLNHECYWWNNESAFDLYRPDRKIDMGEYLVRICLTGIEAQAEQWLQLHVGPQMRLALSDEPPAVSPDVTHDEDAKRDYIARFISRAVWDGAILLNDPELDGSKITAWSQPISNFLSLVGGHPEATKFIAPEVRPPPSGVGERLGSGQLRAMIGRLRELEARLDTLRIAKDFTPEAWENVELFSRARTIVGEATMTYRGTNWGDPLYSFELPTLNSSVDVHGFSESEARENATQAVARMLRDRQT